MIQIVHGEEVLHLGFVAFIKVYKFLKSGPLFPQAGTL